MGYLLLEKIEYKIEQTEFGAWRRYVYPTGMRFAEFRSHAAWGGLPFLHYTFGVCPETGKRIMAKGVIAVGRMAAGLLAIGQLGLGLLFGIGQASSGFYAVGQLALGGFFGLGQLAIGYKAIGQFALGKYILAQIGFGSHAVLPGRSDPEALEQFRPLLEFFSFENIDVR